MCACDCYRRWRDKALALVARCRRRYEYRYLRRFSKVSAQQATLRKQLRALEKIRRKEVIHVVFQVYHIGMWKNDSLMKLMMAHPRFSPVIWIVSHYDTWPTEQNMQNIRNHCKTMGFPYVEYADVATLRRRQPVDFFFIQEPYNFNLVRKRDNGLTDLPLCYAPYCFRNHAQPESYNNPLQNITVFNFFENSYISEIAKEITDNHGARNVVTGQLMVDTFVDSTILPPQPSPWKDCGRPMKKVIWAPHWSLNDIPGFLHTSTFMLVHEAMLELAEKYADRIQFAFKPHPSLRHVLLDEKYLGPEKTEAYYRRWAEEMPNTQYENGDYVELFRHSDAMIHDCGSFMLEYLLVDKPCMYLRDGEGFAQFNEMSKAALTAYYKGVTKEEIERFLTECVLGSEDAYAEQRRSVRETYLLPPNGCSAAENIIAALLGNE